jgi:hypothetical protein
VGFEILTVVLMKVQASLFLIHVSSWAILILKMEAASSHHNGNYLQVHRASYPRRLEASTCGKNLRNLSKEMQYKE